MAKKLGYESMAATIIKNQGSDYTVKVFRVVDDEITEVIVEQEAKGIFDATNVFKRMCIKYKVFPTLD